METAWVRSLARQILALSEPERQELAREVLPVLLTTRAGLAEIDASLRDLSDDELRALVERARQRASDLSEDEVAAIIAEGLRAMGPNGVTFVRIVVGFATLALLPSARRPVERSAWAGIALLYQTNTRVVVAFNNLSALISRTIIDNNHLKVRKTLRDDRGERALDVRRLVEQRNDYRDAHG